METHPISTDSKYQKLATEYAKIRAHANILKSALLEEQNKGSCLRETLRIRETALRRAEQEVDSLGFRNKQLEHRVATLQDDNNKKSTKLTKGAKNKNNNDAAPPNNISINDSIFAEELQNKIFENAKLLLLVADKGAEIDMLSSRISELEEQLSNKCLEFNTTESKLRKELDRLTTKNSALESKLATAGDGSGSLMGSDDTLSVSESDHTPVHQSSNTLLSDEKVARLERELFELKTKNEYAKICDKLTAEKYLQTNGASNNVLPDENNQEIKVTKDQLIYNHFSKKLEEHFIEKSMAESKVKSYIVECESLRSNLDITSAELLEKEQKLYDTESKLKICDDDLATTRINYEEQISVLTEQVISLSDQLASLK